MYHCLWRKIADNSIVSGVVRNESVIWSLSKINRTSMSRNLVLSVVSNHKDNGKSEGLKSNQKNCAYPARPSGREGLIFRRSNVRGS